MSDLIFTVTTAGRAALVNAENTGTAPVLISHCGVSPVAFTADPAATTIPAEVKRISTLAGDVVADDTIHVTVRDESADIYSVRSIGLYLGDGTLFAVYSQPAVIMEKSAQAVLLLTIDVQFPDIDATSLTFGDTNFINPAATTERQGVVELATEEESTTGTDTLRAVTPKGMKSAVTSWLNDRLGAGAPSAFVKGLLAIASGPLFRQEIGLGNVDNTSDANKPISTATQNALNAKADAARSITAGNGLTGGGSLAANRTVALGTPSTITTGTSNSVSAESHTHALTISKADIGLDNVDNTSDAAKPISTATQNALNQKVNKAGDTMTGNLAVDGAGGQIMLRASDGSIEITRFAGGAYIDFKDSTAEDYDVRLAVSGTGLAINGGKIWTAANDGSGSGLNADLFRDLTPEQVVSYARIIAGLTYTPARGEGSVGNGDLNAITQSGMYRTGRPVNGPPGIEWGQLLVLHGAGDTIAQILFSPTDGRFWARSGNPDNVGGVGGWSPWRQNVDADFLAAAVFQVNGATMQRNGHHLFGPDNHGPGSNLNADLLDNLQSWDYVQVGAAQTISGQKTFAAPPIINSAPVAAVTGTAPIYGLRAWVNFSGKGVPYIRGAGNVSSITDENVGLWTINFATPMPDANYCPVLGCNSYGYRDGGTENIFVCSSSASWTGASLMSTTALRLMFGSNISGGGFDADYIFVGIAR